MNTQPIETEITRLEEAVAKCAERDKRLGESLLLVAAAILTAAKPEGGIRVLEIDAIDFGINTHRVAAHLEIPDTRVAEILDAFIGQSENPGSPVIRLAVAADSFYPL